MKTLIIYDTLYGNTEKIAKAIGEGIGGEVKVEKAAQASTFEFGAYDLLVVGAPTQGGKQSPAMLAFLGKIPDGALQNKSAAAFDTRMTNKLVKIFGYAAGKIADVLTEKGASLIVKAEPFWVKGGKGPLADGEEARAKAWGQTIAAGKK